MAEFRMPQLGADMEAGVLTEWLVKPGDEVERGDIVAVVETDKGAIEIEIFEGGVIDRLLVEPGTRVPVGTVLAMLRTGGEPAAKAPPEAKIEPVKQAAPVRQQTPKSAPPAASSAVPAATVSGSRFRISPAAARLAAERGVDVSRLRGTGPGGAIRLADVEATGAVAPQTGPAARPEADRAPVQGGGGAAAAMRRAIGAAMSRSKREIPHYYVATTIDMRAALSWLERFNAERPVTERLLYGALLVKATALALRDFPDFNGFWRDEHFVPGEGINVGMAIALRGGGLVAPALHGADELSLADLMSGLRDLVARARSARLRSSELSGPTITVTSLGDQGVDEVIGVIYPPQVALVGFGRVVERPWVTEEGTVEPARVMHASLAADHRVSDGHRGGLFLAAIEHQLQEPEAL